MKKIGLLILILLISPFLSVRAQEGGTSDPQISVGIRPAIIEVILNTDGVIKQEISVFNLTDTAIPMTTSKESFAAEGLDSVPADKLIRYDASAWITLSETDTNFTLQPNEIKTITLNILKPVDASPGGHYATVYFQPAPTEGAQSESAAYIDARVASLVLMQIPGETEESMAINNFTIARSLYETPPIAMSFNSENTGNIHLLPSSRIEIYDDLTNQIVSTVSLKSDLILPGLQKSFSVEQNIPYVMGKFSAQVVTDYGAANAKEVRSERVSFYIIPYKFIIVLIVAVVLLIVFRKRISKSFKALFNRPSDNNK